MLRLVAAACAGVAVAQAPGGYDESAALEYSYISTAAYCGAPKFSQAAVEAWACGPACDGAAGVTDARQVQGTNGAGSSALVGRLRGRCLVAFRGTSDLQGWLEDIDAVRQVPLFGDSCFANQEVCMVGDGWAAAYTSIADDLLGNLTAIGCTPGDQVVFTGHSMGGAQAVLAAFDFAKRGFKVDEVYTFGQPRVGNAAFAAAWAETVGTGLHFRVSHHHDPVVHLPSRVNGFQHFGQEVFYDGDASNGYRLCDATEEDPSCVARYDNIIALIFECVSNLHQCDHLQYMVSLKEIRMDGSTCVPVEHNSISV